MKKTHTKTIKRLGLTATLLAVVALALPAGSASAAPAPVWHIGSLSNTTAPPGSTVEYFVEVINRGDAAATSGTVTATIELPPGLTGVSASTQKFSCPGVAGASVITCTNSETIFPVNNGIVLLEAKLAPGAQAGELLTTALEVSGGGAASAARTVDPIRVSATPPAFGLDAFDGAVLDPGGQAFTKAGGHPDSQSTDFDLNTATNPNPIVGQRDPVEDVKRVKVELPPGFLGNPAAVPTCTIPDLSLTDSIAVHQLCDERSQVGTASVRTSGGGSQPFTWGPLPLFNVVPAPGSPARFGFNIAGTVILLDTEVRSEGDYGVTVTAVNTPEAIAIAGAGIEIWGVPSDEKHRPQRACPDESNPWTNGPTCKSTAAPQPFFRNPTSCSEQGLETRIEADSWQHPGAFAEASYRSHEAPGYPLPTEPSTFPLAYSGPTEWGEEVGIDGCAAVPFTPSFAAKPTTDRADSPSGLEVDIGIPQDCWDAAGTPEEALASICQSDMRDAEVTLPEGMSVNPSSAGGLGACSPGEIGLSTPVGQSSPIHFDKSPVSCPDSSKIGTVEIDTPLLSEPLSGAVYLAQQGQNPFGSLLGMYLVAEGSGVVVKQAGEISVDPVTGQLRTRFADAPQTPFSNLHLELFGGPRAPLRTPAACGTYTTDATLAPWSGNPAAHLQSSFGVTQGCGGGFDPKLSAGTENPLAAAFSPFSLRLSRDDASQELAGLRLTVPPGLVASLKDIPYCPDATLDAISGALGTGAAQLAAPSCPAASQVGTVIAGAGAGPLPFYSTTGKAYWAGPYKGAPVSLAVVVPALAGPFDLGSVVVRNGFEVDPESARITAVSDPFPRVLHGIPLDLREIRLNLNRPSYTLNPTSCEPLSFEAEIQSTQGTSAQRSQRFQVTGCDHLRFKPKLSLRLRGKTNRGAHPALTATLRMPAGGANLAAATVALPHSEFLDQAHIGTVCTRVQYAAGNGGGEQCPAKSIYGQARAYSPILGYYLKGQVFLRSSSHQLPDLVLGLHGPPAQPIQVDAVGRIDSTKAGGIRTSFAAVPDVPVSKVVLEMRGGSKGLLQNSTDACAGTHRAAASYAAHNGALLQARPALVADCGPKGTRKGKGKGPGKGNYRR
jgi:uncharacterized repeat protein (TIGR01451 family)